MRNRAVSIGVLTIALLTAATLLVACGSGSDRDSGQTTLSVWAMGEEGKLLGEFASRFEADNPDIRVQVQAIPWASAHDKLLTAVASGNGPDVLQIGTTWVAEFGDAGTFLDLSAYLDQYPNFAPDNFFESAVDSARYEEAVIGVPWYVDTRVLFYRTDLLGEAGYPEGPQTWDDVYEAGAQFAARENLNYGLDIDRRDQNFPLMMAWQQGWSYETDRGADNFNDPAFMEAMRLYTRFFAEGITPTSDDLDITQAFREGIKPMFFSGPWMVKIIQDAAPELEGSWDVTLMPEGTTRDSMIGGAHLTVFHNSQKVEEALQFISFLADAENQKEWYEISNALPAVTAAWEVEELAQNERLGVFGQQMEQTQSPPMVPQYERIAAELIKALERIIIGGEELEAALEDFRAKAASILAR